MDTLLVLLFLFFLVLLPVGLAKPSIFNKVLKKSSSRKQIAVICIAGVIVSLVLIGVISPNPKQTNTNVSENRGSLAVNESSAPSVVKKQQASFEQLNYGNLNNVENFDYLYSGEDKSKDTVSKIADDIKSSKCKKPCNISIYDEKKAYELDHSRQSLTSSEDINAWDEKNYVYVADHLIGFLNFDSEAFSYYPYRDSHYKELTGQ